jgi:hypothetical protein
VTPEQKKWFLAGYRCGRAHAAQSARWLARRLDDEAAAIVDIAEAVRRPRRQRRVIASLFCSRIAMILTSVRVGLPARRRAGERAGRPMRLRTGAAVSRACFQSHEICTVNFMAISAIASGSSLLAPTLTSASMPRVPRKVTAVPDETPKLTF